MCDRFFSTIKFNLCNRNKGKFNEIQRIVPMRKEKQKLCNYNTNDVKCSELILFEYFASAASKSQLYNFNRNLI